MHHPTDRITHTTAFVTPVVEHWLEREIAQFYLPTFKREISLTYLNVAVFRPFHTESSGKIMIRRRRRGRRLCCSTPLNAADHLPRTDQIDEQPNTQRQDDNQNQNQENRGRFDVATAAILFRCAEIMQSNGAVCQFVFFASFSHLHGVVMTWKKLSPRHCSSKILSRQMSYGNNGIKERNVLFAP